MSWIDNCSRFKKKCTTWFFRSINLSLGHYNMCSFVWYPIGSNLKDKVDHFIFQIGAKRYQDQRDPLTIYVKKSKNVDQNRHMLLATVVKLIANQAKNICIFLVDQNSNLIQGLLIFSHFHPYDSVGHDKTQLVVFSLTSLFRQPKTLKQLFGLTKKWHILQKKFYLNFLRYFLINFIIFI